MEEVVSLEDHLFAIEQLDAFGKPPSDLLDLNSFFEGSYDECQRVSGKKYQTNYCYILVHLGSNSTCDKLNDHDHLVPRLAVCMPKSCTEQDLVDVFNQLTPFPLTACGAFCVERKAEKNWAFWTFLTFMTIIISLVIVATVAEYFREREIGMSAVNEEAYVLRILLSFSLWSNAELLLSVREHKPGYIRSLDCIRAISVFWIITCHTYNFQFSFNNIGNSFNFLKTPSISRHLILNAFFSFDTLLVTSGVVTSYLFFWNKPKRMNVLKCATWIVFLSKRYFRSMIPLISFIWFFAVFGKFIQGPFIASEMDSMLNEAQTCESHWWINLLYVNNFSEKQCHPITWFLAVEFQLFLISPALLIALFLSLTGGVILIVAGCLISVITTFALFGLYDLPADFIGNGDQEPFRHVVYEMPWTSMSPYLLGILVGYLLANFTKTRLKFHRTVPIFGWILSIGLAAFCLGGNYAYDSGNQWSVFQRATFFNFTRIGWAIFVSWIVIATHYRWGGPIGNFMCHPIWQPVGRLSYCAFIVHRMVLFWFFNLDNQSPHSSSALQMTLFYSIPGTVFSFFFAFWWSALFEMPTAKIEKIFFFSPVTTYRESMSENHSQNSMEKKVRVRRGGVIC